ncbi:hypothetical protein Rhe02_10770 [Rhizocola hellebori]|uniref:Uncharacterized protein n=1 Tax=Rhizocola hellebori TaxID=1392758 RepID=A0A8J3VDT3_9ACTN|nr:hypothetical protein [Rhizocola hellebori]GIH03010.1 hypothetical protein Rhe02_10770 [Rhizocola hellebori]
MSEDLSSRERVVLLTLLLHGPILSNSKKEAFRLRLAAPERDRLNALGLIVSVKAGSYRHRLTEAGHQWCLRELASGRARAGDSRLERNFYALLGAVRGRVDLPSMFSLTGGQPDQQMELAACAAYRRLRSEARGGVSLADLLDGLQAALRQSTH